MTLITVGAFSFFAERVSYVRWMTDDRGGAYVYLDHTAPDGVPVRLAVDKNAAVTLREELKKFAPRVKAVDSFPTFTMPEEEPR